MPKGKTIEDYLNECRDELCDLAGKLNQAKEFRSAMQVQGAILTLDALGDLSDFDNYAWPPVVEIEPDGCVSLNYAKEEAETPSVQ
jgi:hypothetical protein